MSLNNRSSRDEDWGLPELEGWKHKRKKKKERGPALDDYLGPALPEALDGMITGAREEVRTIVVPAQPEPQYVAFQADPDQPLPPLPKPSRRFGVEQLEHR